MTVPAFVDSNVLVYAATSDAAQRAKKAKAVDLIGRTEFGLSAQVLAEFYSVVTHKVRVPMAPAEALAWIDRLERLPCVAIDSGLVKRGAAISVRYQINYWDGAIIAAAEALGAGVVYSEDMNHDQTYGTVKVLNPFIS